MIQSQLCFIIIAIITIIISVSNYYYLLEHQNILVLIGRHSKPEPEFLQCHNIHHRHHLKVKIRGI